MGLIIRSNEFQSATIILDKTLLEKMKDIENLSDEDKKQVYYVIDMALSYHKTKRAFAGA